VNFNVNNWLFSRLLKKSRNTRKIPAGEKTTVLQMFEKIFLSFILKNLPKIIYLKQSNIKLSLKQKIN